MIKREQLGESRSKKHGVLTNHHWMKISWPVISCTELPLFCRLGQTITPSTWQAISSNYQPVFKHEGIFTGFGRTSREIKQSPKNVKVKLGIIIPGMYGQLQLYDHMMKSQKSNELFQELLHLLISLKVKKHSSNIWMKLDHNRKNKNNAHS